MGASVGQFHRLATPWGDRVKRFLLPLFGVAVVALLLAGLLRPGDPERSGMLGRPAPEFVLTDLAGREHRLAEYAGRPVVLNFWASWCVPCHAESPLFARVANDLGDGVQFLGLVYNDDPRRAGEFMNRYRLPYPALEDPRLQTAMRYGVGKIPVTYIVDARGNVVYERQGPVEDEAEFRAALRAAGASQ